MVSKEIYLLARPYLYRTLQSTLSKSREEDNERLMHSLLNGADVRPFVQEINIICFPSEIPKLGWAYRRRWRHMIQLLPQLGGLRHVSYAFETSLAMQGLIFEESGLEHGHETLPDLLWLLNKHPATCRLSVILPARIDLISVLSHFINKFSLYSLTIVVHRGQVAASEKLLGVVSSCPNLRELRLMSQNFTGPSEPIFITNPGRKEFTMWLHKLEMQGPILLLKQPEDSETGTHLFNILVPETASSLSFTSTSQLINATSSLPRLRSLQMDMSGCLKIYDKGRIKARLTIVLINSQLEELSLTGSMEILAIESLEPLEQSLRNLRIRENEDEFKICTRQVFSHYEIKRVNQTLPKLQSLSLDLNYNGSWVREALIVVANELSLRRLLRSANLHFSH